MTCPTCGFINRGQAYYCAYCSTALPPGGAKPSSTNLHRRRINSPVVAPTLIDWRLELRERVRAFRARRHQRATRHQPIPRTLVEEPVAPAEPPPRHLAVKTMLNRIWGSPHRV